MYGGGGGGGLTPRGSGKIRCLAYCPDKGFTRHRHEDLLNPWGERGLLDPRSSSPDALLRAGFTRHRQELAAVKPGAGEAAVCGFRLVRVWQVKHKQAVLAFSRDFAMSHTCEDCGVQMPIEDGHMKCVLGLGEDHASAAREDPSSCMNCFIIPRPSLEARCCLFRGKKRKASVTELSQEKRDRGLGTRSKTPMIGPPLTITVHDTSEPHEQEDVSDVDVECFSDSDLAPDQEGTASVGHVWSWCHEYVTAGPGGTQMCAGSVWGGCAAAQVAECRFRIQATYTNRSAAKLGLTGLTYHH
uniref:Uncharacterized protein n=1 Tax=Knipowitschia caucasica TaxID=637954 RepID=A0AAV2LY13_KNICA